MNQGHFTAVAADALILYSNYLIEQISAHGCKMYCPGHFIALGGETLVHSNYLTEHTCTWM
jgi:hypothetical protein